MNVQEHSSPFWTLTTPNTITESVTAQNHHNRIAQTTATVTKPPQTVRIWSKIHQKFTNNIHPSPPNQNSQDSSSKQNQGRGSRTPANQVHWSRIQTIKQRLKHKQIRIGEKRGIRANKNCNEAKQRQNVKKRSVEGRFKAQEVRVRSFCLL
jgi:hypothetical protein